MSVQCQSRESGAEELFPPTALHGSAQSLDYAIAAVVIFLVVFYYEENDVMMMIWHAFSRNG